MTDDDAASEPGRVEQYAETICRANCRAEAHPCDMGHDGTCLPGKCPRRFALASEACAAIALADAESAERAAGPAWQEWRRLSAEMDRKIDAWISHDRDEAHLHAVRIARAALDAFVAWVIAPVDSTVLHQARRRAIAKMAMQDDPWSRGELPRSWRYEKCTEAERAPYLAYADRVLEAIGMRAMESTG